VTSSLARIRRFFTNNLWLKLLAVVLATVTFFAIQGAINFEVSYDVPVEVRVEKGIAILDQDTRQVLVTFRGSQEDLRLLDPKQIRAVVKPHATDPAGAERVVIGAGNIEGAARVRVVRVWPGAVTLTYDHEAEKTVAIAKPKILGTPLMGKVEVAYEPRTAKIRGPQRRLDREEGISTEPIDVDGRVASFSKIVKIIVGPAISSVDPPEVKVDVKIVTETVSRELTNVVVCAILEPGARAQVEFNPPVVNVTLNGQAAAVEGVIPDSIKVFVDCEGLQPAATYELPVSVHLSPGADVTAKVTPETVRVIVRGT
jgi:hypothetical protein